MEVFLIAVILLNCSVIFYLWNANRKSKAMHAQKTELLESIIVELLNNYEDKNEKLKLAEEIKEQLRITKNKLNVDVLALQYEFLEVLSRNKLVE